MKINRNSIFHRYMNERNQALKFYFSFNYLK